MVDIPEAFKSPNTLISHARDEIEDAHRRLIALFDGKHYAVVVDFDSETGEDVHKVRLTAQIPDKFGAVVKDAATNLRDALDHAVYAATWVLTSEERDDTGFPFARNANGVKGELGGKRLAGNPPEIRPFLESLQPHETGNQLLWGLNKIRNPNTHRIIVPVGTAGIAPVQNLHMPGFGSMRMVQRWVPAKNEVEFLRAAPGTKLSYQVASAFKVVFEGKHPLAGKPVVSSLREIAAEVERVVLAIKAETVRLLAIRPV